MRRAIKKQQGKRAVIYVRVSSEQQSSEGLSLQAQRARLEAYCELRGLDVVHVITDPAQSAFKPLAKRRGGRQLLDLVARKSVDAVIVYKLDRAFRRAADCLEVVAAWDDLGVALHLVDMGGAAIDTRTAVGKLFLTMLAGFAEFERGQISERTSMALAYKAAKGERIGNDAPFGWTHDEGRLVESAIEQETLGIVRQMRADGTSLRQICASLARVGIRNRAGGVFAPEQIVRMLRGPKRQTKIAA